MDTADFMLLQTARRKLKGNEELSQEEKRVIATYGQEPAKAASTAPDHCDAMGEEIDNHGFGVPHRIVRF